MQRAAEKFPPEPYPSCHPSNNKSRGVRRGSEELFAEGDNIQWEISRFILYISCLVDQPMEEYWDDEQLVYSNQQLPSLCVKREEISEMEPVDQLAARSMRSLEAGTRESSKNEKKRLAGQKSREKKKNYVKNLEESVKMLGVEIDQCDLEISRCKDQLVEALRTCNSNSNEHTFTFTELERIALSEDPDLYRVNLLIDIIRNRIGANGKERQANINYNFKQIVNSMFPAIYRYLFNAAENSTEVFVPDASPLSLVNNPDNWTQELYADLKMEPLQIAKMGRLGDELCYKRREAVGHMRRLDMAKEQVKVQGEFFERGLASLREKLTPVQCAQMTIFAERNKLRRQFTFCAEFQDVERPPYKVVKRN